MGGAGGSAGQYKRLQRRQPDLVMIDGIFQRCDITFIQSGLAARVAARDCRKLRTEVEELALDASEQRVDIFVVDMRSKDADAAVKLVDFPVRLDALVGLRHAGSAKESGIALITCFCIDLHAMNVKESVLRSIALAGPRTRAFASVAEALRPPVASEERRRRKSLLAGGLEHADGEGTGPTSHENAAFVDADHFARLPLRRAARGGCFVNL